MTDARTVHHYESLARDAGWDGDALHVDRRAVKGCRGCRAALAASDPDVCERCDLHSAELELAEPETHHAWEWRELLAQRAQVTR